MLDLQALFAEMVLANITAAKNAKNMTDIALINALAERGAFSNDVDEDALEKTKESKRNLYNDWRSGKSKSYLKLIETIAQILETDVWTLSGLDTAQQAKTNAVAEPLPERYTNQEKEIIAAYRRLDLISQKQFLDCLMKLRK